MSPSRPRYTIASLMLVIAALAVGFAYPPLLIVAVLMVPFLFALKVWVAGIIALLDFLFLMVPRLALAVWDAFRGNEPEDEEEIRFLDEESGASRPGRSAE